MLRPKLLATGPGCAALAVMPRALSAPRQLEGEQEVHQLRQAVGAEAGVAALELQVVEVDLGRTMRVRRDVDDARARRQAIEQEVRQEEVAQVIEREGALEALRR